MNTNVSTIRPGILVAMKTELVGGVTYAKTDLDQKNDGAVEVTKWETTKVVVDPAEHKRARQVRSLASATIRRVCIKTSFALLCPDESEEALWDAVRSARKMVDDFNEKAVHSRIGLSVIPGRVASTDAEAARAISNEMAGLLAEMERAVKEVDVKSLRDAATRAKAVGRMLDESKAEKVGAAVAAARAAAREIVKRVEKGGEDKLKVLGELQTGQIETARFAFLDFDEAKTVGGEKAPAAEVGRFAGIV